MQIIIQCSYPQNIYASSLLLALFYRKTLAESRYAGILATKGWTLFLLQISVQTMLTRYEFMLCNSQGYDVAAQLKASSPGHHLSH
jgi:hypothetical protein